MSLETPIIVLAGPTGSGKTALGIELATRLSGELVGADSVQVYRGFDIGSAKPTPAELGGVRHHLLDIADPNEAIDAMRFAGLADQAIDDIAARGKVPLVVGGTGLWLRALIRGLVELPPVDPAIRAALEAEVVEHGATALFGRLVDVDPVAAERIHPNDALRIVRALEVHAQTGVPLGELRARHALGTERRPTFFLVLEPDLGWLTKRIHARVDAMLAAGWLDEMTALRARWGDDVRAFGSVGYRQWLGHLRDGVPFEEARQAVNQATRLYARRQRNWFRAEPGVTLRLPSTDAFTDATFALLERHARP